MTGTDTDKPRRKRYSRVRIQADVHVNQFEPEDMGIPYVGITVDGLRVVSTGKREDLARMKGDIARLISEFAIHAMSAGQPIKEYRIP